jgi:hypothetical protein
MIVLLWGGGAVIGGLIGSLYDANVGVGGGTAYYLPGHVMPDSPTTWEGFSIANGKAGGALLGTTSGVFIGMVIWLMFTMLKIKQAAIVIVFAGVGATLGWLIAGGGQEPRWVGLVYGPIAGLTLLVFLIVFSDKLSFYLWD